jgi:hypothetical protein
MNADHSVQPTVARRRLEGWTMLIDHQSFVGLATRGMVALAGIWR